MQKLIFISRLLRRTAIIVLLFGAATLFAQGSVTLPTVSGIAGTQTLAPVNVSGLPAATVVAFQFTLSYDNSKIYITGADVAGTMLSGSPPTINADTLNGRISMSWATGTTYLPSSGTLLNLRIKFRNAGTTTLTTTYQAQETFYFNNWHPTVTNGSATTTTTQQYTVTTSSNPTAGGTTSGGGSYNSGSSVTLTATANSGYSFVNWTEGSTVVSTNASYIFNATANRTLVANFVQQFSVSTSSSPTAGGTTTGGGTYNSGQSVTVTAAANSGYSFVNWTEGGTQVSTSASYTFTISANKTLVANFAQQFSVTTSSSPTAGGTTTGGGSYNPGLSVTVTATANSGYSFVNWTEGSTVVSTNASYTFTISNNRTLVANFSSVQYTVATSSNPTAGGTTSGGGTYTTGQSVTVTAVANTGYGFISWTEGGTVVSTNASYSFIINSNKTLVANFVLQYSVTTSSNPTAGGTTSGGGSYTFGQSVTVTATANSGYNFVNWTEGSTVLSSNASYAFTITSNKTLVANFTPIQYTVTTSSSPTAGGTTSGGGTYNSGQSVTVTATANSGYTFANWTEGSTVISTNASYTFSISSNRTLIANFTTLPYTVTTSSSPTAGGTTSGGGTYTFSQSVTVTANANSGFSFVNWTEGSTVVSTNSSYPFTINSNRTLVANFTAIQYTVSTLSNPSIGGTTSGSGTFNSGQSITVIATPNSGYSFVNWTEGGTIVSTSASYTFSITSSRSLVANFALIQFTVTTNSNPTAGGTTSAGGTFNSGQSVTVTATANSGYNFINWTEGSTVVSTNASYTFTITANRNLVANFAIVFYTVTTSSNPTAGGTTSGGATYSSGTSVTVTATPNSGYNFVNWTDGSTIVSTNLSYTFTITSSRSLVANFALTQFTVTTSSNPSAGGTTTGGGSFNPGQSVTVTATANGGFNFVNWTEGVTVVSTSASYNFTVNSNRDLVANFTAATYTVTLSPNPPAGGTLTGSGIYSFGEIVTVKATPNSGYQFVSWTEGGTVVSTGINYAFVINASRALVANFVQLPVLSVTPDFVNVNHPAGTTSFSIANTGGGTLNWSAVSNTSWITITGAGSGTNSGTINVSYSANTGNARTGTITVTATGASGSPKTVEVKQATYTDVRDLNDRPETFNLYQNFPNPFNPTTNIKFNLSKDSMVSLKVYNILGQEVAQLINKEMPAGSYQYDFDASQLTSGLYLYRIQTENFVQAKGFLF